MTWLAPIPAAGSGSALSKKQPKQYAKLAGRSMLWHAIRAVCMPPIESVFVVLAPGDRTFAKEDWKAFKGRLQPLYCGGKTRRASGFTRPGGATAAGSAPHSRPGHDAPPPPPPPT